MKSKSWLAVVMAVVASTALWSLTAQMGGKREPWDYDGYWTAAYPTAVLFSGLLGFLFPRMPWLWALITIFSQAGVMIARGAELGMLPFGMILMALLSVPAVLVALGASWLRRRVRPAQG